jgi:hypothetical protein
MGTALACYAETVLALDEAAASNTGLVNFEGLASTSSDFGAFTARGLCSIGFGWIEWLKILEPFDLPEWWCLSILKALASSMKLDWSSSTKQI